MARTSSFRKSGGFLNGVDGRITGYQFTDEFNGVAFKPSRDPKTKKEKFHSLYFIPSVRVDGATEDVTTTLFVGGADDFEVSEDGHTLTPVEDGRELGGGTGFSKFVESWEAAAGQGSQSDETPEGQYNFTPLIGSRVRLIQRVDDESTKKLGKRKDKKTGREYSRTDLVVETVYELTQPAEKAVKSAPKAASAPVSKSNKTTNGSGKTPKVETVDIKDLASETLVSILADTDSGTINKIKLSMAILKKITKHLQREDVRKYLANDDNLDELASEGLIAYDRSTQLIEAAA